MQASCYFCVTACKSRWTVAQLGKRDSLNISQLSWICFLSRNASHGILPSRGQSLLKSGAVILVLVFLLPLRILKLHLVTVTPAKSAFFFYREINYCGFIVHLMLMPCCVSFIKTILSKLCLEA